MELDQELISVIVDNLKDLAPETKLPLSELRQIALQMIDEGKLDDGAWAMQQIGKAEHEIFKKRNIARVKGYYPFINLSKRVYQNLLKTFGEPVIGLMREALNDPEDIYTKWAFRFAHTLREIGFEECLDHKQEIYEFITTHRLWESNKEKCFQEFESWITEGKPKFEDTHNQTPRSEEEVAPSSEK